MKRKSLLLTVLAFTSFGLVGCQGNPSVTPSETPSDEPASSYLDNDTQITRRGATTLEVNQQVTYRFSVGNAVRNKLVNIELDNPDVAGVVLTDGFDTVQNNVSSVKIQGLEPGTVKRKVTSIETGNSNTFELTVIEAKPTLREALTSLASATNYTFTGAPEDETRKNAVTTTITKRVEKALTVTNGEGENIWLGSAVGETDETISRYARYGIAVNSDDEAFYIDKNRHTDEQGNETTDTEFRKSAILAVNSSVGFRSSENFAGDPENFSSYLFTSFANIDPTWATADKADDNIYSIAGDDSNTDAAFLECRLWERVDASGMRTNRQIKNIYTFVDAASWIDTTVEVLGKDEIKIVITPTQGSDLKFIASADATALSDYPTRTGTLSAVGTTSLDTDIRNYLASDYTVQLPGLNSAKKGRVDARNSTTYKFTNTYQYTINSATGSYGELEYNRYYTPEYCFTEIPEDSKKQYTADTGTAWTSEQSTYYGENTGFALVGGKVHEISYTAATATEEAKITVGDEALKDTQGREITSLPAPGGYIFSDNLGTFATNSGAIYRLSDTAAQFWNGDTTPYYSNHRTNSDCFDTFCLYFLGVEGSQLASRLTGTTNFFTLINTETDSQGTVTALNFQLDARAQQANGYYSGYRFDFSMTQLGTAKSTYDSLIKAAIAA